MENLIITPKTKIYDLLEAFPQLEDTLIKAAPQFKKLKNPLLRKTIARITNLSQAASVGGLNVEELVNTLRQEIGQSTTENFNTEQVSYKTEQADWFSISAIVNTIDIREMLHAGEQPVHEVLFSIKKLNPGEILEIIAPFLPAPLIDKAIGLGHLYWILEKGSEEYYVYFTKGS